MKISISYGCVETFILDEYGVRKRRFLCSLCDITFVTRSNFERHFNHIHNLMGITHESILDIDNRNVTELPDSVMEDSDDINQETL